MGKSGVVDLDHAVRNRQVLDLLIALQVLIDLGYRMRCTVGSFDFGGDVERRALPGVLAQRVVAGLVVPIPDWGKRHPVDGDVRQALGGRAQGRLRSCGSGDVSSRLVGRAAPGAVRLRLAGSRRHVRWARDSLRGLSGVGGGFALLLRDGRGTLRLVRRLAGGGGLLRDRCRRRDLPAAVGRQRLHRPSGHADAEREHDAHDAA